MSSGRAVVVGASHAGAQLVTSLRQGGWSGEILLVGDEPVLPYQRPPLSKAYLAGKLGLTELAIRSEDFYLKQDIKRVAATVEEIDRSAGELVLGTGERGDGPDGDPLQCRMNRPHLRDRIKAMKASHAPRQRTDKRPKAYRRTG